MEAQRTKYLSVVGLLGIVVAAVYINSVVNLLPSPSILVPLRSLPDKFATSGAASSIESLGDQYRKGCPKYRFKSVKLVSSDPNVMIIEEFLTSEEAHSLINAAYYLPRFLRKLLRNISNPLFSESTVLNYDSNPVDKSHRDSWTAYLGLPSNPEENDSHAIIKCIEERAAQFQGYVPVKNIENLQVVKYLTCSVLHF